MVSDHGTRRLIQCLRYRIWVLIALLLAAARSEAGEITHFALEREGDGYRLQVRALIEAPFDGVWRVLTDYAGLHRVSPRIVESELAEVSPEGVARVRTVNRLCFLVFCHDLRQVQLIRQIGDGDFESNSIPEESNLSYGYARWRLFAEDTRTRLDIDFNFAMDSYSWVPPWVSLVVARSVLKADAAALIQGIERVVRAREGQTGGN